MNLKALRDAVLDRSGHSTNDTLANQKRALNSFINAANRHIAAERDDWPWLQADTTLALEDGTAEYDLPARHLRTTALVITDADEELRPVSIREAYELEDDAVWPGVYAIHGTTVRIAPTPSAADTLTWLYVAGPETLAAESDSPGMPEQFHDAVVEYAVYLLFRRTRSFEEAGAALEAYRDWLARIEKWANRTARHGRRVRVRPGGGLGE